MLIDYRQLKVGDEVIISKNSNLKYIKILALPKAGTISYRCSCKKETIKAKTWRGQEYLKEVKEYPFDISKHNSHYSQDFRYRDVYLVKRVDFD